MTDARTVPADSRDMYAVHNMIREGFGGLPALVRGVGAGEERAARVADHARMLVMIVTAHHEAEDAVLWPALTRHCPDEAAAIAGSMEGQHRKLHSFLGAVDESAARYRALGGVAERDYLAQYVEGMLDPLREHLAEEERAVLPLVDRHLTRDEWAGVGEHGLPLLSPEQLLYVFGMMLRVSTDDQRAALRGTVPPEVFGQMEQAAPPALEAYERGLHGAAAGLPGA